jgi:hypothetical protein
MQNEDLTVVLNDAEADINHGVEQLMYAVKSINLNVENLKPKTSKPDKATAQALLEYIAMEESITKGTIDALCSKTIEQYMNWIKEYCKKNGCDEEKALNMIINEEI